MIKVLFQLPTLNVIIAIIGVYFLLLLASITSISLKFLRPQKDFSELLLRIKTFWVIISLLAISLIVTTKIAIIFWAIVSFLALKEYFTIIPTRRIDRQVLFWAYLAIIIQYYWIGDNWYGMFSIFIPV